jgi:cytochrome c550
MNPIKVFIAIFSAGVLAALILGLVGTQQVPLDEMAEEEEGNGEEVAIDLTDAPDALAGCLSCHGNQLEGSVGPGLIDIDMSEDEIIDVLENGIGSMPAQEHLSGEEMDEIASYLVNLEVEAGEEADEADEDEEADEDAA